MKKAIPFDLFGEKQELCFTILGLEEFERIMGKSIQQIVYSENVGVSFCLNALPICLKRINPHLYAKKIEAYFESGGTIADIASLIVHAICVTGVLGKNVADATMALHYPESYEAPTEDETPKNE